jgi:hypothetical protein
VKKLDYGKCFSVIMKMIYLCGQGQRNGMRNLDDSKDGIDRFLKRNPDTSFVAVEDNAVIGVILCGHDEEGIIFSPAVKMIKKEMVLGTLGNTVY